MERDIERPFEISSQNSEYRRQNKFLLLYPVFCFEEYQLYPGCNNKKGGPKVAF